MSDKLILTNWTSGNKQIDDFIQEKQLKTNTSGRLNPVIEWIPYDRFEDITEISKVILPQIFSSMEKWSIPITKRLKKIQLNKKVNLKCLYNSQNITDEFLN